MTSESPVCIPAHARVVVCNKQYFYSEVPYFSNSGADLGGSRYSGGFVSSRLDFLLSHYNVTLGTLSCSLNFDVGPFSTFANEKVLGFFWLKHTLREIVCNCRQ